MSFTSPFTAPQKAGQDRRSAQRRRPHQLVYANFGPHNGGIVIDVSEDGIQFQSVERIMLGDSLPVTFVLTGAVAAIKATAAVVWCNDTGKGGGLRLLDLPKTTREEISTWVSSAPSSAASPSVSPEGPPARGAARAPFNLLTTEGRIAPEPASDDAAMAMARLLVSARGYARPDSEAQATLPIHERVHDEADDEARDEVRDEVHRAVPDEVQEEVASPFAPPAALEPEAQTEIPSLAETAAAAIPEAIPEAAAEVVAETVAALVETAPLAETAPPVELAEQRNIGSAQPAVETPADASPETIALTEAPDESPARAAIADAASELPARPEATAAEAASRATGELPIKATDEVTDEVIGEAAAVAETHAEAGAEKTLLETEPLEATVPRDAAEAETLPAHATPAHATPAHATANPDVGAPAALAPVPRVGPSFAEDRAVEIAPAIADEFMERAVAGLESKSERAAEIPQPLPLPQPADAAAAERAASAETVAQHTDDREGPATALVEILLAAAAAAEAVSVAPPAKPIPVAAPAAAEAARAEPIFIAPKAENARVPNAEISRKPANAKKSKGHGPRSRKASPSIRDSMQGLSILPPPEAVSVPAAIVSPLTPDSQVAVLPGWGAEALKFAIGVGLGCCLVAGAFVGMVLLGPGHRPLSIVGRGTDGIAEASAPAVGPTLDVEVIDLGSRRWHVSDSTPSAQPFAPEDPVVELTPGDSRPAAAASLSVSAPVAAPVSAPAAKSPLAKSPVAKLSAAKSSVAKPEAARSLVARSAAPKLAPPPAPKAPPLVSAKAAAESPAAPLSVAAQPAPNFDSPTPSESPKNLALASPVATRGAGNSSDLSAPSITESISSSISYPMGNSVGASSAPVDPRTPVSSNPVFPSALLLPPARHNADFHVASPIRQDNPIYPPLAKRLQVTGTVRIDAFVGKDGRAHSLKVISGDPRLSSATLAAVSEWTFRPAQLDGESVESEVTISVNFDLR